MALSVFRPTLVAFDAEDAERLLTAGYQSQLVPAFSVRGADGRSTNLRIEGSVKGSGAVADLVPRLRALLSPPKN